MKEFFDLAKNKKFTFEDKAIFSVYVRRNNGKRKLIFASANASKAFDTYHTFKIFKRDRKYLEVKMNNEDIEVYSESGKDPRAKSFKGYKTMPNYEKKILQNITNIPVTLHEEFVKTLEFCKSETNSELSVNKCIPLLIANFCSLAREERDKMIKNSFVLVAKHKVLSGGNNTEEIKRMMQEIIESEPDTML